MTHSTVEPRQPLRGVRALRVPRQRQPLRPAEVGQGSTSLRLLPAVAVVSDVTWLCLAMALVAIESPAWGLRSSTAQGRVPAMALAVPAVLAAWVLAAAAFGAYSRSVLGYGAEEYHRVVKAAFAAAAMVGIFCYLTVAPLSRGYFLAMCVVGTASLLLGRALLRAAVRLLRRRGHLQQRVLLVGDRSHVSEVTDALGRDAALGFAVVGTVHGSGSAGTARDSLPNQVGRIAMQARTRRADVVFIAGGAFGSALEMRRLAWELEHDDVQVVMAPSVTDAAPARVRVRPVGGLPLVHLEKPRSDIAARRAKRAFDAVGAALLLVLFAPVMFAAALWIRLCDGGPALVGQQRVGRDGTPFTALRFRTTVPGIGAETLRTAAAADPATTTPGRWLRRHFLDELPQLVNVLTGEMSLVGPRPLRTPEIISGDVATARRLSVRPGMTGLCRVSRRPELTHAEARRLDLYYVDNWSMVQDLSILAHTLGAALRGRAAIS